ncbi:MAG: SpoIIE family protein phosphatase, partial [Bacteroidota bacterium]
GVPGAFTSMIGKTLLDQIVKQENYRDPGAILDVLEERFQRWMVHSAADGWQEGMDMVLCALDKNHQRLSFAGAHRPVLLLRNEEVLEWRTDRRPIGGSSRYKRPPFCEQSIELQPEDQLYLFTDGYTDQMGGPEYRKFKHGRFHRHLLKHRHLPMAQQLKSLSRQFRSWKGDYRQMDDILVLGLRIEPVPDPIPIVS